MMTDVYTFEQEFTTSLRAGCLNKNYPQSPRSIHCLQASQEAGHLAFECVGAYYSQALDQYLLGQDELFTTDNDKPGPVSVSRDDTALPYSDKLETSPQM
jgi:hypothetical protein